ncbi:MAG: CDP-diacylglycerol--glycerol-3-phosphate 3-phosphatidyltransferase [Clostridia bacterium]|nr:CDP-diacylglycerol--glycerol-3-phosphate 3-phosphatidyltransferase [Clostridia bacterium]
MNLPNKLTILRIIMIPFFLFFLLMDLGVTGRYIATAIFCIASFTDCLDGYIARKYNLITNFGKFMDPLADKLLVCSAMIALIGINDAVVSLPSVVVIIIIAREFVITGFRTLAVEQNIVIAAGFWGKLKTICQMAMLIVLLLNIDNTIMTVLSYVLIYLSLALAVISAFDYIVKNKQVLKG